MKKLRNLSLTAKLLTLLGAVLVLVFGVLITVNLSQLKNVSLAKGELEAQNAGKSFALHIEKEMTSTHGLLTALTDTLQNARAHGSMNRAEIVELMRDMLTERPQLMGLYTLWEPGAFDRNDKQNVKLTAYDDETGRFIPYVTRRNNTIVTLPQVDYETPGEGDFYLVPKQTKKIYYMDPYVWNTDGETLLLMSIIMPITDEKGNFLGAVGADISLDSLQAEAGKYKPLGGYVSLIGQNGAYAANPNDPETLTKPFGDRADKEALWKKVQTGGGLSGYTINSKGEHVLRVFEPIVLPGGGPTWYTQTAVKEATIFQTYNTNRMESLVMAVGAMLLIGVLVALLLRYMVLRPIVALVEKLKHMADGDLTQKLDIRSGDEFGKMARYFNLMTTNLRDMFQTVADLAMSVGATSQQLTASAEQTSNASVTIAESMQEIAAGAELQNSHAGDTAKAMGEVSLGVQRIAESSVQVSQSAGDASAQTAAGNELIRTAVGQMEHMRQSVEDTETAIGRLMERTETIGSIIGLITGISTQTNMLALNASIEASRAGEAGRGFAVVAAEVRKLAGQTRQAAEQVSDLIGAVSADAANVSEAMNRGAAEVREGVRSVTRSGELFGSILTEIANVSDQIQEVSASAEQMTAGVEQVTGTVEQLSAIAKEATGHAQGVAAASEEQVAAMEEISASAEALSSMVQELMDKMARFKI